MAQEEAMEAIEKLSDRFSAERDCSSSEKLGQEIEKIEIEYTDARNQVQEVYDERSKSMANNKFVRTQTSYQQASVMKASQPPESIAQHSLVSSNSDSLSSYRPVHQSEQLHGNVSENVPIIHQPVVSKQQTSYGASNRVTSLSATENMGHYTM